MTDDRGSAGRICLPLLSYHGVALDEISGPTPSLFAMASLAGDVPTLYQHF
jgi:hypothetical protein